MIPIDEWAEDLTLRWEVPVHRVVGRSKELNQPEQRQQHSVRQDSDTQPPQAGGGGDVVAHDRKEQEDRQEPEHLLSRYPGAKADRRARGRKGNLALLAEGQNLRLC